MGKGRLLLVLPSSLPDFCRGSSLLWWWLSLWLWWWWLQVIFIAIFCSALVFGTAFFIWRRKAKEQMRNEVKAILADYMQLDDVGNEEGDNARMLEMGSSSSVAGRI